MTEPQDTPTITHDGSRVWIDAALDSPYATRLRRFGAHWDFDTNRWWVGVAKAKALDSLMARPLGDAMDEEPEPAEHQPSAATILVEMACENYTLGVTDTGEPFGIRSDAPHLALMLRGGKTGLRAELARRYWDALQTPAPQQAISDACMVLEGMAADQSPQPVHLRVAQPGRGVVYIDMADDEGRIIEISGGQWYIDNTAPGALFRRTKLTGPMPKPAAGGDISKLWEFVHIAEEDRPLVLAWMVAALIQPNAAHTVLALLAEHGSAKSTMTRCLVDLIDPSSVPLRKAPRDADGWVTAANASWVVALDNLSGTIPLWLSDCLCRASTGDGDVRRQLYTDLDVAVVSFRRCVVFNGIDVIVTQGDLADRLLRVHLHRIEDKDRRGDEELAAEWADARPQIFGGLLDLASGVQQRLTDITVENLPRMADFARVLAGVDEVLGTNGLTHYRAQSRRLAADTLDDGFIGELTSRGYGFTAKTSSEILAKINRDVAAEELNWRQPRGWPRNAREVTAQLTRHAPAMRAQGWSVEDDDGQNKHHATLWWIFPPDEPEKACDPGSPTSPTSPEGDNPKSDGIDGGEVHGEAPTSPTSPTSPDSKPVTSEDEVASQASYKYSSSLVRCKYCGDEIPEHMTSARARGHCAKARCIYAANQQTAKGI